MCQHNSGLGPPAWASRGLRSVSTSGQGAPSSPAGTFAGCFHLLPVLLSSVTSQEGSRSELKSKLLPLYVGGRESSCARAPGGDGFRKGVGRALLREKMGLDFTQAA